MRYLLACAFSLSACVTPASNCEPTCDAGADQAAPRDLAPATCSPKCGGLTPKCNAANHCVGCVADADCPTGTSCKIVSDALATCAPGCTDDARCGAGKCCGGSCADVAADAKNCGGCGMACTAVHAKVQCLAGQCMNGSCDPGWGDCNGNAKDGCEANLHADKGNCTACGKACAIPNAYVGCADGCYVTACKFGFDDCDMNLANGCETSVISDANNCGACGKRCALIPNATASCINGSCVLGSCNMNYKDCDKNAANGCEVRVDNDGSNCGACGFVCAQGLVCISQGCTCPNCNIPNASTRCVNNMCVLDKCNPGFADCDGNAGNGCEANLSSDPNNCSQCGMVCPMNAPNCAGGMCAQVLGPLKGTSTSDVTRGTTYNAFFADPVTGRIYWSQSYNGASVSEFSDIASFNANANGRVFNLQTGRAGTYMAALNGFLYYSQANASTMVKARVSDGMTAMSAPLPGAGNTNQSHFLWGGYTDIDFFVDSGNLLYVMWAAPGGGQIKLTLVDPGTLALGQTWTIPRIKTQTGFAFLANGVVYLGFTYSSPAISARFLLNGSVYDAAYVNSLTPVAGEYVAHTYWNPAASQLLEVSNMHHLVYPNVR